MFFGLMLKKFPASVPHIPLGLPASQTIQKSLLKTQQNEHLRRWLAHPTILIS